MHRWVEHTSEVELSIEAGSAEEAFAEALAGLGELLAAGGDRGSGTPAVTLELSVSAPDLPALLVEWLNELLYLSETEGFVGERVLDLAVEGSGLEATVAGRRAAPQTAVKGATYHGLELEPRDGAWRGRVVLDV